MAKQDCFHGYAVIISQLPEDDGGGWYGEVPQLTGCFTTGDSPEEVFAMLQDAIQCWLAAVKQHKQWPIPAARPLPLMLEEMEPGESWKLSVCCKQCGRTGR